MPRKLENSKATDNDRTKEINKRGTPDYLNSSRGFYFGELLMTLKKTNKMLQKGQAIFEYFILTAVVVGAILFFAASPIFQNLRSSCENAFNQGVEEILR